MLKLLGRVPVIGTADTTAGLTMRTVLRKTATPTAFTVYVAFTISLPIATFLPGSGHLLQKGDFLMAKATASGAKPGTATDDATPPPARDPRLAVEEARRLNTVQSLELFIARHPDDPLAARARADLRSLSR
jgi:hypothetical protein